ncbi:hypothetical protein BaRGS_00003702, partial [Batillaria attramentaria]
AANFAPAVTAWTYSGRYQRQLVAATGWIWCYKLCPLSGTLVEHAPGQRCPLSPLELIRSGLAGPYGVKLAGVLVSTGSFVCGAV